MSLAALLALALTLASLEWDVPFGSSRPLARYTDGDISFSYPKGWHTATASGVVGVPGSGGAFVLSSQGLLPGYALLAHPLVPGGVLVTWSLEPPDPPAQAASSKTSPTTIGGRPATLADTQGDCSGLDADNTDQSITAIVEGRWGHRMEACLRGPGLAQVKAQVQAMLRSVSFRKASR